MSRPINYFARPNPTPHGKSRSLHPSALIVLAAALIAPTAAMGFGSNGFLWDAAPRNYIHTDGKVWERSLDGGLRYSVEGGSYEAYRNKFTWIGATPSVPDFTQAVTNAFNTWTTTDPATGLGTGLYFVEDLGTPVEFFSNCCWLNPLGAEIDLVSSVQTDSNAIVPQNIALPITNYGVPDNLKLTSGRTDVSYKPFLGVDIHMGNWAALPYTISSFENILRHELGHALGLGDVEYSNFIDDNYDGTNPATALATLTNPWANNINPLNPADPTRLAHYGSLDADPGVLSPGVDIFMESRGSGGRSDLSNDDYAGRQYHYPQLHFLNPIVVDGFGFEPEGDFTNQGSLTLKNNGSMNIPTSTLTLNSGSHLSIESGSDASNTHAYINGLATVKDPGSTWTNSGILFISTGPVAVVNVNNGATLTSAGARLGETTGSTGSAIIENATWNTTDPAVELFIGNAGTGVLSIQTGGVVNSAGHARLGDTTTGHGNVTVNGPGATWNNTTGILFVGNQGTANLDIINGGQVTNFGARVGEHATASATVNVTNGTWTNSNILIVGNSGTGNLNINTGGTVSSTFGWIADGGGKGTVTVNPGGQWNNYSLRVGNSGTGALNIQGGTATTTADTTIGPGGTINLSAGTLATTTINNTAGGTFNWTGGLLHLKAPAGLTVGPSPGSMPLPPITPAMSLDVTNTTTIEAGAALSLAGGSLTTASLSTPGTFNWTSGLLNLTGPAGLNLGFSPGDMFFLDITAPKTLNVTNTTTIDVAATLSISGGALTTRSLNHTAGGGLNHTAGSLAINGGSFLIASTDYHINGPGTPALVLDAATFNIPNTLYVGNDASGHLALQNGATVRNTHGRIGESPLANGTANVAGGIWINSNSLIVGNAGTGSLTINDTGAVAVGPGGTTIGPAGTINLNNGTLTTPSLTNATGGTLNHTGGTLTINGGSYTPPAGPYTISGPGTPTLTLDAATLTNNHNLTIGHADDGILNLQNNATLTTSGIARIGSLNTSTASQVTVDAATWTNNGTIIIGHQGTGALTIQNHATVTSPNTAIAHDPGSAGTVSVDNATWTSTDSLAIGFAGPGTLTIRNGATVTNQSAYIGVLPTSAPVQPPSNRAHGTPSTTSPLAPKPPSISTAAISPPKPSTTPAPSTSTAAPSPSKPSTATSPKMADSSPPANPPASPTSTAATHSTPAASISSSNHQARPQAPTLTRSL